MNAQARLIGVATSLAIGAALGLALAAAPPIAGDTAITDPVWLGLMWFVRPQSMLVIVPPLIHLGLGAGIGVLRMLVRPMSSTGVILIAVSVNGAATLVENGYGAGVAGVLWWLIGTVLSAALMLVGAALMTRVADTRRATRAEAARS